MEINDKIAENLGLVYGQLKRFNLTYDQDAESLAYEALYKAIQTYRDDSGNVFSTYAICVIANALRMHLRAKNKKRQLDVMSYDEPIDESLRVLDTLVGDTSIEDQLHNKELSKLLPKALTNAYNGLANDTQRRVIDLWQESDYTLKQREIANSLNVSQPVVSRAISSFRYKLSLELEEYM